MTAHLNGIGPDSYDREPEKVKEQITVYLLLLTIGIAILVLLIMFGLYTWSTLLYHFNGIEFKGGPTSILFILVYLILSLKVVPADMRGGVYFYGLGLKREKSGLKFVPFGFMQIILKPRTVQEFQCPGDPEIVFKGDDRDELPTGMVRPIRVVTRAPDKETENGILDVQMTLVVNFFVQYAVDDVLDFVANFGSDDNLRMQVRDIGEAVVAEDATQLTPAGFIAGLKEVNKRLAREIGRGLKNSGVQVVSVRLISPDITHEVSTALANIPIARAHAEKTVTEAEAEKTKLTKEGEGRAAAKQAELFAEAEGLAKQMSDLRLSGDAVLAKTVAEAVLSKTNVLLAGGAGMADIAGLVSAAQAVLNTQGDKK